MMEWTREQRYLPYDKHNALELLKLQTTTDNSPEQLRYHIRPFAGLLNDPNGFSYFNGAWHVFYQSFPFGAAHGLKSWMHMESTDLVHWKQRGLALTPDCEYDSHGAYSGSAKQVGDKLFLMYTGNHRDENWVRTPYQLGAWMDRNNNVEKVDHPLIKKPDYISEHFRDPQILEHDGKYYAILGAQVAESKEGHIDLWESDQLLSDWHEIGLVNFTSHKMGYMIECPNLVFVDDHPVFVFCPQGMSKNVTNYDNIYPDMYITGDRFDFATGILKGSSDVPVNLDDGFDVYASQAFNAPDGKAYLISWVGLPDLTYPTDGQGWANCLSQVKELHLKDGKLLQQPVSTMTSLRDQDSSKQFSGDPTVIDDHAGQQCEIEVTIAKKQQGTLHLIANDDLTQSLKLIFDTKDGQLNVDRETVGQTVAEKYGTVRSISLPNNTDLKLRIFIDHSLAEIFVNNGEHVITLRYFADQSHTAISFNHPTKCSGTIYQLKEM